MMQVTRLGNSLFFTSNLQQYAVLGTLKRQEVQADRQAGR